MKHKIKKESSEFEFFKELYSLRQDYYFMLMIHDLYLENEKEILNEYYKDLTKRVSELNKKYENEPFYKFVKGVLLAHLNDVNERSIKCTGNGYQ